MNGQSVAERFAENLVILRRRTGLSQENLGFLSSLHRTEISHLEAGKRDPKISTLLKLSGALGVSPLDLLKGIEWKAAPDRPLTGKFKVRD